MHLSEAVIEQHLHGELSADGRMQTERHLADCDACRERLGAAQRADDLVSGVLAHLDRPLPPMHIREVTAAAQRRTPWMRLAASIALLVGLVGLSYALPGSPVRTWLDRTLNRGSSRAAATAVQVAPTRETMPAGIAVPAQTRFQIDFVDRQRSGSMHIRLVEDPFVTVRTSDAQVRFTAQTDRLIVSNAGSAADFEIAIPANLASASVRIAGRTIFSKTGDRIVPATVGAAGNYTFPLQ
jgi:hypothetical protein